jgi:hypothetical protein
MAIKMTVLMEKSTEEGPVNGVLKLRTVPR